jgi:hypothetical protein
VSITTTSDGLLHHPHSQSLSGLIYFVSLDSFDICFLNDIAVANSGLLHQYSLVDPRVRELMMTVKQWAKEFQINSAKDNFISSYAWMNLVIFYLQNIGFLPNLQSPLLMEAVGLIPDPQNNYWHAVDSLDTCTLTWNALKQHQVWNMPKEFEELSIPALLYGFYEFYGFRFPWTFAVSIKQGTIILSKLVNRKVCSFFSIEDPFETYDSHCPHDLGTPAKESGSSFLMNCLRNAERHLFDLISKDGEDEQKLWPDPPIFEPQPLECTGNKQSCKRFEAPTKTSDSADGDNTDAKPNNVDKNESFGNSPKLKPHVEMQDKSEGTESHPNMIPNDECEDLENRPNLNPSEEPIQLNGRKDDKGGSPLKQENEKPRTNKPNQATRRRRRGRGQQSAMPRSDQAQRQHSKLDRVSNTQNPKTDGGTKSDKQDKDSTGNPPSRNSQNPTPDGGTRSDRQHKETAGHRPSRNHRGRKGRGGRVGGGGRGGRGRGEPKKEGSLR